MNKEDYERILLIKVNKFLLKENNLKCMSIEEKLSIQNFEYFYNFAEIFNLQKGKKTVLRFAELFFGMISETQSFLEFNYNSIKKILGSSKLYVDSELQVYIAVNKWLRYNYEERKKFANELVLKVRFELLSEQTLRHLLKNSLSISQVEECVEILSHLIISRVSFNRENPNVSIKKLYRNQIKFDILICGGFNNKLWQTSKKVTLVNGSNPKNITTLSPMITKREQFESVCSRGVVYVFGGRRNNEKWNTLPVEKYSPSTKAWSVVAKMFDDRIYFSACAFIDKAFIMGGHHMLSQNISLDSCFQFDTNNNQWMKINGMKEARSSAASVLFKERIVICGGRGINGDLLNSVEFYDVFSGLWASMPNMITGKSGHGLAVANSKLYVVAERSCEVFDDISKCFVALKPPKKLLYFNSLYFNSVISIGNKLVVYRNGCEKMFCYDINTGDWSEDFCEATNNLFRFSSIKVPSDNKLYKYN